MHHFRISRVLQDEFTWSYYDDIASDVNPNYVPVVRASQTFPTLKSCQAGIETFRRFNQLEFRRHEFGTGSYFWTAHRTEDGREIARCIVVFGSKEEVRDNVYFIRALVRMSIVLLP